MIQEVTERLVRVISKERLSGYTTLLADHYRCSPIALYRWNVLLSESLYPALQTIEVVLRNAMFDSISKQFQDTDWLLNQNILEERESLEVLKQTYFLQKTKQDVSIGKIIAELNFGFWTSFFDSRYEMKLWRSKIIKNTFPYMPSQNRTRRNLSRYFNLIRKLRNRVFHYEPIWYWEDLKEQYENILMAIRWIEPEALNLCKPDRFLTLYKEGPSE